MVADHFPQSENLEVDKRGHIEFLNRQIYRASLADSHLDYTCTLILSRTIGMHCQFEGKLLVCTSTMSRLVSILCDI